MILMDWDLLGHDWAVSLLRAHIAQGEVRHAYLFSGPAGVGRRTLAIRLAQALNCPEPIEAGQPCRKCRTCRQIEMMQHADLFVVQADKEGGILKVDQIRELQHSLSLHPYEARYKIALLLRFEEANQNAMNALLKTLEEPAPQVKLLLTAESPENLLPTIVSRCELIRLRPLPLEQVEAGLMARVGIEMEQARLLAHISGGRPGFAIRLAADPLIIEERTEWLNELRRLLSANVVERFDFADGFGKDKEKMRSTLIVWSSFWRDVVLKAASASTPIANLDWQEMVESIAVDLGLSGAGRMVGMMERAITLLERNVNSRLVAEVLMLDLPLISIQPATA
jgi:DNA polymerase-3 subunit delta'